MFLKKNEDDKELKKALKNILGFLPGHLPLYIIAFTHRSSNEDLVANNERLEFLGDAYIGSIVGEYLFKKYPNRDEGFLTEMRSKIVSRNSLNDIALKMGLQKLIRFNKNDKMLRRSNIFGNCLEALVGAIYLDKGFEKTRKFILKNMLYNYIDIDDLEITEFNFKNKLYNWAQINNHVLDFVTLGESNEAGRRVFTVGIEIDGEVFIKATGYNKKAAGQTAAQRALEQLEITSEE
ncbi:MAG: ribonuclease III [Sphingobacteriales bacterium]|nr:MAG: ribonuclease III [Sphingobacteriales bacterium]